MLFCATGQACNIVAPRPFSACVSAVDGPPRAVQDCVAAAGSDCVAARACAWDATHTSVCTFGEKPSCDGNIALTCDGATTTTSETDCSLVGALCVAGPTSALCARGTCDAPGTARYCAGDVAAYCAKPFLLGPDCGELDATCVATDGGATCQGRGSPCFVSECAGDDAIATCLDGRRGRVACPPGQRCFPPQKGITLPICGIAGECDPAIWFDLCLDGLLTYCHLGRVEILDCPSLGFAGCSGSPLSGCVTSLIEDAGSKPLTDMPLP